MKSRSSRTSKSFHSEKKILSKSSKQPRTLKTGIQNFKSERLQKVLSRLGLGSRREIETWIAAGRVEVNGKKATLGCCVDSRDRVKVDGRLIRLQQVKPKVRILAYHKPVGEMCSRSDPEGRPTVFDHNPKLASKTWVMVGRLDFNTAGLLLFTNDGELAHQLMHPSNEIEREYAVRVFGELTPDAITRLREGVKLADGMASFSQIKDAGGTANNHWYHVVLKEGRNREVRRLFEALGYTVTRLIRVRFGNITLPPRLRQGKLLELTSEEIYQLRRLLTVAEG